MLQPDDVNWFRLTTATTVTPGTASCARSQQALQTGVSITILAACRWNIQHTGSLRSVTGRDLLDTCQLRADTCRAVTSA